MNGIGSLVIKSSITCLGLQILFGLNIKVRESLKELIRLKIKSNKVSYKQ